MLCCVNVACCRCVCVLFTRHDELLVELKWTWMASGVAATSQVGSTFAQGSSIVQASAVRALQQELKKLKEEPVEGFLVRIPDEANMFEWEVAIFGSPGSLYEGGYFKVCSQFCHFLHILVHYDYVIYCT